ncbi:MAG: ABC transporter permease [Candidatus Ryanbacteria bacterium]|nr:ABC transporter permease [Candidatus Ryanbacteria bacterium]
MRYHYFHLIKEIALSDFKLRYHGSWLGVLWSFLKPLLMFGVLFLVFSVFIRFDTEHYALYLLLGIILWNFFAEATTLSLNGLDQKAPLIKKIAFPRTIIIVSSTLTALLSFLFNIIVFALFFTFSGLSPSRTILLVPVFVVELYFIALGASFLISALYAKFRDIRHIWEILLQLGFWLTPIIYPIGLVPQAFSWSIYLNPLTRVIQYSREAILQSRVSNLDGMAALFLMTVTVFFAGYFVFKKRSPYFAEEL